MIPQEATTCGPLAETSRSLAIWSRPLRWNPIGATNWRPIGGGRYPPSTIRRQRQPPSRVVTIVKQPAMKVSANNRALLCE